MGFNERLNVTSSNINILMIDDDVSLTELIDEFLQEEGGFGFTVRHDGEAGVLAARECGFDVIILDVMMPKLNGFSVLKAIREFSDTPIIMLTARGDDLDRILGLETGADDYVPKPCSLRELLARIRVIVRRTSGSPHGASSAERSLQVGDLRLESGAHCAYCSDNLVNLTGAEYRVLESLVQSAGDVVSKDDIARKALGRRLTPFDRSVDAHVVQLRKKLGPLPSGMQRIKTLRGRGYLYIRQ